jgi:hypothetical protein
MKKDISLIDWMLCDDIRREDSGKLMFIGVYLEPKLIIKAVPTLLPQLTFFSKWKSTNSDIDKFDFAVCNPAGEKIVTLSGEMSAGQQKIKTPAAVQVIQIGMAPFKIDMSGKYEIKLVLNGTEPHTLFFEAILLEKKTPAIQ